MTSSNPNYPQNFISQYVEGYGSNIWKEGFGGTHRHSDRNTWYEMEYKIPLNLKGMEGIFKFKLALSPISSFFLLASPTGC